MRPARVAAGCRPAELLARDDSVVSLQPNPRAQVPVDRETAHRVLEDDVVVETCTSLAVVAIELAVLHRDDAAVERGEDGHPDVHLAKAPDVRVCSRMPVVRLRPAGEVAHAWAGVEIDEVGRIQIAPEDPGLRVEGELTRSVRAARSRGGRRHDEREQGNDEGSGHTGPSR